MSAATPTVGDLASLVRSKNAGPFWLTLDVFCPTGAAYEAVAADGVLTPERVGDLYRVEAGSVRIFRLPHIRAIKVSFPRPTTQGALTTETCTLASSTFLSAAWGFRHDDD